MPASSTFVITRLAGKGPEAIHVPSTRHFSLHSCGLGLFRRVSPRSVGWHGGKAPLADNLAGGNSNHQDSGVSPMKNSARGAGVEPARLDMLLSGLGSAMER